MSVAFEKFYNASFLKEEAWGKKSQFFHSFQGTILYNLYVINQGFETTLTSKNQACLDQRMCLFFLPSQ